MYMSLKNGFVDENADPNLPKTVLPLSSKQLEGASMREGLPETQLKPPFLREAEPVKPPGIGEPRDASALEMQVAQAEEIVNNSAVHFEESGMRDSAMGHSSFPAIRSEDYFAMIIDFVNSFRSAAGKGEVFQDPGLTLVAREYSLLESASVVNQKVLGHLAKKFRAPLDFEVVAITFEVFEEETNSLSEFELCLQQAFAVLAESDEDAALLTSTAFNCAGCGLKVIDQSVSLLILLARASVHVERVELVPATRIDIFGRVLAPGEGPFFLKVVTLDQKDSVVVLNPQSMKFEAATGCFVISTDRTHLLEEPFNLAELYLRHEPENIKYGQKSTLSHVPRNLEMAHAFPLVEFPFRTSQVRRMKSMFQSPLFQHLHGHSTMGPSHEAARVSDQFGDFPGEQDRTADNDSESSQQEEESENASKASRSLEYSKEKRMVPADANPDSIEEVEVLDTLPTGNLAATKNEDALKSELESTLEEAFRELRKQTVRNMTMQEQIACYFKEKQERDARGAFVCMEFNTNEIKYVNSIALISEIRKELKGIRAKYAQATQQMNDKLNEKTAKFKGIQDSFGTLKREICCNAQFESSSKRIPPRMLQELEMREADTARELQMTRLEIIKMRRLIEKNGRALARKEELADGLHLIDFEKLKIENQSLNEKIEERNEEISKLVNKNVLSIHILAHLKEKLHWEQGQMENLVGHYDAIGDFIRQGLPRAQGAPVHRRKHPQGGQAADVQAHPRNRHRQEPLPQTRLHQPQTQH